MPGTDTVRGHLEKKKEWILRARDFQSKNAKLRQLKRKAEERNPDEFHFHMVNSRVGLDGVHRELETDSSDEETETQRLLSDVRDIQYVTYKHSVEKKKIEKLQSTLHFTDSAPTQSKRTIFVDSTKEARKFNPTTYFKALTSIAAASAPAIASAHKEKGDPWKVERVEKQRKKQYAELKKRVEREAELRVVVQKLELKKNLALSKRSLKPKLVSKGAPTKPAVYRWTYERKK